MRSVHFFGFRTQAWLLHATLIGVIALAFLLSVGATHALPSTHALAAAHALAQHAGSLTLNRWDYCSSAQAGCLPVR